MNEGGAAWVVPLAFDFEVAVEAVDVDVEKVWTVKRVYSPGYHRAPEKDGAAVSCVFAKSGLPPACRTGRGGASGGA